MNSRTRQLGFTALDLLVAMAIAVITITVVLPVAHERLVSSAIRTAADQLSVDIRAARMIAVSKHMTVDIDLKAHPVNSYEYQDAFGRLRRVELPSRVRIAGTDQTISLRPNGEVPGGGAVTLEAPLPGDELERWTVSVNVLGVLTTTHERVIP